MINKLISLPRINKQLIMLLVDSIVLVSVLLASFSIRLGYWYFPPNDLVWVVFGAPIIAIPIFIWFGLYHSVIRYIGVKALWSVMQAVSLYALVWGIVGFMAAIHGIPRSVILINWILSLLLISGIRIFARALLSGNSDLNFLTLNNELNKQSPKKRVLVYGAGNAGIQLVSALTHSSEYKPVGFIDDLSELQGKRIRDLRVYSSRAIGDVINNLNVDEVLIAMPSASRARRLDIINTLEPYPVLVRMLPSVADLAQGKVSVGDLRKVSIKDLLGRDAVEANKDLLGKNITDKVVMVTGAGGSIGSELSRQILSLKPKALILYEVSEFNLYNINEQLQSKNEIDDQPLIIPILGSVNSRSRLAKIFNKFGVQTIYHAAAYKHVPMVEFNTTEGVYNNVFGTLNCAQVAIDQGVETFVLISTDKAVRPTNTMGASKRCAELVLQALQLKELSSSLQNRTNKDVSVTKTRFSMVRFGNVLGSSGSVIPLFKQQIKAGGPVTVTDKEMIRYFMTIPEAVELVIQAGAMATGGDVFVLDMGEPVRINDLARKMIQLSGLKVKDKSQPDGDIEIKYTGLRPGEKLYEELLIGDNVSHTDNPLIMRAEEDMITWDKLEPLLDKLKIAIMNCDHFKLRELLVQIVPDFKPQCDISDVLYVSMSSKD